MILFDICVFSVNAVLKYFKVTVWLLRPDKDMDNMLGCLLMNMSNFFDYMLQYCIIASVLVLLLCELISVIFTIYKYR